MFGLARAQEKRQIKAETARAERAFDAARMQPLQIQQDIARRALQECVVTMARLSAVKPSREQESLYLLRLTELEQQMRVAELQTRPREMEPSLITTVFTHTLLAVSSGLRQGEGLESIGAKIAQWSRNILPDFDRFERQFAH
jgi:hypothetical protein